MENLTHAASVIGHSLMFCDELVVVGETTPMSHSHETNSSSWIKVLIIDQKESGE